VPKISIITPSIRPRGLEVVFNSLQEQTFKDFEWLPRLSIPGEKPDLCRQCNRALGEATGEWVVFWQDWIKAPPDMLETIAQMPLDFAHTFPVAKLQGDDFDSEDLKTDWRAVPIVPDEIDLSHWEIDFGIVPLSHLKKVKERFGYFFDEDYDSGFGWENVDLAERLSLCGTRFRLARKMVKAFDHDKATQHPFKHKTNQDLWIIKKAMYNLLKK